MAAETINESKRTEKKHETVNEPNRIEPTINQESKHEPSQLIRCATYFTAV